MDWIFRLSEAFDAIVFGNAISADSHYARHYPGLRDAWRTRLGDDGLDRIEVARGLVSASTLAHLLAYLNVATLDDVIAPFADFPASGARIATALHRDRSAGERPHLHQALNQFAARPALFRAAFERLRAAGFARHWWATVRPGLADAAIRLSQDMAAYPLDPIRERLRWFLGNDQAPPTGAIFLAAYVKPIAFTLPAGALVAHPETLPSPAQVARLSIHESLHGFPGSLAALAAQDKLRSDPRFARQYRELLERWHSGPEEFLVSGAEAYLTERLGLRSHEECLAYLRRQNGGMPLAITVYLRLREADPEAGWSGFGPWVAEELRAGRIRPTDG